MLNLQIQPEELTEDDILYTTSSLPLEYVVKVTPFPNPKVTNRVVRLSEITSGKPSVLHLYTG